MELHIVIKEIVNSFGANIYKAKEFINILDDYQAFNQYSSCKFIFRQLFAHKLNQIEKIQLLKDSNTDERTVRNELDNMAYLISYELGLSLDLVQYIVYSLAYGIGLVHNIQQPTSQDNSTSNTPSVIGLWDFYYKEGECMNLTIKRDGTAIASSGTKYLWKCPSNNEIIIYIDGMVSYVGQVENNLITGIAFNELYFREWSWHAELCGDGIIKSNLTSGTWKIINQIDDLADNIIEFVHGGKITSSIYGNGTWNINDDKLTIVTANNFITYVASMERGKITGVAKNKANNKWNFELIKII